MPELARKLIDHMEMQLGRGLSVKGWKRKALTPEPGTATFPLDQVTMDPKGMTIGRLAEIMDVLEVAAVIADRKDLRGRPAATVTGDTIVRSRGRRVERRAAVRTDEGRQAAP